jgi:hypothetical protein
MLSLAKTPIQSLSGYTAETGSVCGRLDIGTWAPMFSKHAQIPALNQEPGG